MARISGKLTGKALGWDRNAVGVAVAKVPADGGRVFIGRIAGTVSGLHQTVNDETGEVQTGLKGSFRGISSKFEPMDSGNKDANGAAIMVDSDKRVIVTAGRCYLPGGLQEMVEAAYAAATQGDGNAKNTVDFALDLYAIPATNKAGYSYDGDTVMEASATDPLDTLFSIAASTKPMPGMATTALPAPAEPAPEPAPTPAPEPAAEAPKGKGK